MARLGDLGEWRGGGTPSKSKPEYWSSGTIPWISPKDMKVDVISDSEDHITEAAVEQSATQLVPANSILFVTRSGILVHTFPVARTTVPVTVNQDLKALTPFPGLRADFLAWGARAFGSEILRECSKDGTTVASVDTEQLQSFHVPIAPHNEQRRIVEAIESYFTRLDAVAALLSNHSPASVGPVKGRVARLRRSILKWAFQGTLVDQDPTDEPASKLLERIQAEREASATAKPKRTVRKKAKATA